MANVKTLQRSFAGGELSPEMFGRIDDSKYQSGLCLCQNFIVKPQGPLENRAGFQFVREVKDSLTKVRLIPFTYSTTQTMVLEFGVGYIRFHTSGGTLMHGTPAAWITSITGKKDEEVKACNDALASYKAVSAEKDQLCEQKVAEAKPKLTSTILGAAGLFVLGVLMGVIFL